MRVNVLHALGNADADYFSWDPLLPKGDRRRGAMCTWARIVVGFYLLLLAGAVVFHLWVVIFLVFSCFFARILANLTGLGQHTGLGSDTPDWRVVCHTVKMGPLLRYLYWNMNYHVEHHMYAAVPFFNLAKLRAVMEKDMPPAHQGVVACLRLLRAIKRQQQKEPGYTYRPEFPPTATPPRLQ